MSVPQITLVPLPDRKWDVKDGYEIAVDIAVDSDTLHHHVIRIAKGFVCDLNSMPRFMWWESTPTDYPEAGATHDWLYYCQVDKDIADKIYRKILEMSGMGSFRAGARYRALRMFGGPAYRSHAKAQ